MLLRCTLTLATLFAGMAHAAVAHRCQLADGSIAYRDTGCGGGETLVASFAYRVESPLPPANTAANVGAGKPSRKAHRESPRKGLRNADQIVAHECRFGEQRWVQAQACPSRMQGQKQPVYETRITRAQVCGVLRDLSAAAAPGEGSAQRAYGMNRLRQRHGC